MQEPIQSQAQDPELSQIVRTSVRSTYDFQKLRIQMGNRIAAQFRHKLGINPDGTTNDGPDAAEADPSETAVPEETSEADDKASREAEKRRLDKLRDTILARVRESHTRITDGIVAVHGTATRKNIEKHFQADDLITNHAEMSLVTSYLRTLEVEEEHFDDLKRLVEEFPIYQTFLKDHPGVGPAISAIVISEFDIHKAMYPSSLHKYAGLDVVRVVEYEVDGKIRQIAFDRIDEHPDFEITEHGDILYKGLICKVVGIGRNRSEICQREVQYIDRNGKPATRMSLTFSPFVKTKLLGVLGPSLLKSGCWRVNDERMSLARRIELAKGAGFNPKSFPKELLDKATNGYLRSIGFRVERGGSPYVKTYWDYRNRLENHPVHKERTPGARHYMANRYMVKMWLNELYSKWRALEGLPVAETYAEFKLNLHHGEVYPGKPGVSSPASP